MKTETAKGNGTKNEGAGFGCCNLENFEEMFEKMSRCFPRQDGPVDFSAIRDGMMKRMMEMCCPPKTADSKENTELQKEK
jgi:hypothetical protein